MIKKCWGCGSILQTTNQEEKGFVNDLKLNYCLRCFKIKNYHQLVDQEINLESFLPNLEKIVKKDQNQIFYYVLDLLDFDFSRNFQIEEILKNQKVVIIGNKFDLFPKSIKREKILNYLNQVFKKSKLKNYEIILASKYQQFLIKELNQQVKNTSGKHYFVGYSNVGKSSLINALLQENNLEPKIIESNFFNTTLENITINLKKDWEIVDTPGIVRNNSFLFFTNKNQEKFFYFKKALKQFTFQLNTNQSLIIGGLLTINFYFEDSKKINIHYYGFDQIHLHRTNAKKAQFFLNNHQVKLNPTPVKITKTWKTMTFQFQKQDSKKDLLFAGLGWINFQPQKNLKIEIQTNIDLKQWQFAELIIIREALI